MSEQTQQNQTQKQTQTEVKQKKPKKKPGRLPTFTGITIFLFFLGIAVPILGAKLPFFQEEAHAQLGQIVMYVGLGILAVSVIFVIICVAIYRYYDKHPELQQPVTERVIERVIEKTVEQPAPQPAAQTQSATEQNGEAVPQVGVSVVPPNAARFDSPVTLVGANVQYVPSMEAYQTINMGKYQTLDEKFDQISKMDRTQFVIYVARLFSRKGYQVKLTPVVDNYDIDLLVGKGDVTIAVGCLLTNKVLCKEDVTCVRKGKDHYNASHCMALTNMYFDRTALEYARAEKMSLVDRNILAEDFMN